MSPPLPLESSSYLLSGDVFPGEMTGGSAAARVCVGPNGRGQRLDAFLSGELGLSRSKVKRAVREGHCLVDGKPCPGADFRLVPGMELVFVAPRRDVGLEPEAGELDILYRDEHVALTGVYNLLPPKGRKALDILRHLLMSGFFALMAFYAWKIFLIKVRKPLPITGFSQGIVFMVQLVAAVLMTLSCLLNLAKVFVCPAPPAEGKEDEAS